MQLKGQQKPPAGVTFDSALDADIDHVVALSVLFGLQAAREARIAGLSVSRYDLKAAAFADALARFFSGAGARYPLPIGVPASGSASTNPAMVEAVLAKPRYAHGIKKWNDTADVAALIRNAVSAQQPENAVVILAGPASNVLASVELPGSAELYAKRVRSLVIAADQEPAAFRKLLAVWPTPVTFVGSDTQLQFPAASLETKFAWAADHPVVDAYRAFKTMPYDAPMRASAAVLYAIRPESPFFKTEAGTLSVADNGKVSFAPSADGKHRQLAVVPEQRDALIQAIVDLAATQPPQPGRGGRGGQQNQE